MSVPNIIMKKAVVPEFLSILTGTTEEYLAERFNVTRDVITRHNRVKVEYDIDTQDFRVWCGTVPIFEGGKRFVVDDDEAIDHWQKTVLRTEAETLLQRLVKKYA